ncbi:MAG: kynureninase [Thermomicrobiales bacterium]|nr:kynureninase [Thermomicrobiales bacterium]
MTARDRALELDAADPLRAYRDRFYRLPGKIYMDGNSLGLMSKDSETHIRTALEQWKTLGIDGWMAPGASWFSLGEQLGAMLAPLVGASEDEVVATGTTTVNQHALVATFYRPEGNRRRIIASELDFPSDIYALQSQILLHGGDPRRDLIRISSGDGRTIEENDVVAAMSDDVALVLLPSVLYRSGQLLDIERIAQSARERGIIAGFDCAHSAGSVPHRFDEWEVDFAFWCTYKYLNAGPGSVGALYVNRRHFGVHPGLAGWWGYQKERQFDMVHDWEGAPGAGAWQISTTPVLSGASLRGSLDIFNEAGIEAIRAKSLKMTAFLVDLLSDGGLLDHPYDIAIGTPLDANRRGGHIALEHASAAAIARALKRRGIVPDFRAPNVIRIAPVALYTSYEDIAQTVETLQAIIEAGEHLTEDQHRELVA